MAFKTYHVVAQPDASWKLERPEPLRFAGVQGLIAQWYRLNRLGAAEGTWMVPAGEWLQLIPGAEPANERWIIFEQINQGVRTFARLERINGRFSSETRLMFQFRPLTCVGNSPSLVVVEPENSCSWSEELSIDGGDGSASCSWRWAAPKLGFASVVAG